MKERESRVRPEFHVIELGALNRWAIEGVWPDGRKEQLVGVYTSRAAAMESLPEIIRQFLVSDANRRKLIRLVVD